MIRVCVAVALADRQEVVAIDVREGCTVAEALLHPAVREVLTGLDAAAAKVGIWSRPCARDMPLRDGDRVEIYRPLRVDPKEARRQRARLTPSPRSRNEP